MLMQMERPLLLIFFPLKNNQQFILLNDIALIVEVNPTRLNTHNFGKMRMTYEICLVKVFCANCFHKTKEK